VEDSLPLYRRPARRIFSQGRHARRTGQEGYRESVSEETVARYNALADKGADEDFEKPVLHRIDTPPFYAAFAPIRVNDSYGGLRINGKAQVLDTHGNVIPGLYSGGEASGGGAQHGIGRASVHGYIAGTNAAQEPSA